MKRVEAILRANTRIVAWAIMLVLLVDVMVAIRHGASPEDNASKDRAAQEEETPGGLASVAPTVGPTGLLSGTPTPGSAALPSTGKTLPGKPGTVVPGYGTIPFGVKGNSLRVVYY